MSQSVCPQPASGFTVAVVYTNFLHLDKPHLSACSSAWMFFMALEEFALPACRAAWKCLRFNAPRSNLQPVRNWSQHMDSPASLAVGHINRKTETPTTCSCTHTYWLPFLSYLTPHSLAALPGVTSQINYLYPCSCPRLSFWSNPN